MGYSVARGMRKDQIRSRRASISFYILAPHSRELLYNSTSYTDRAKCLFLSSMSPIPFLKHHRKKHILHSVFYISYYEIPPGT